MTETLLRDTLDLLSEKGWCQNTFNSEGKHCITGAINKLSTFTSYKVAARDCNICAEVIREQFPERIKFFLGDVIPSDRYIIELFNDHPETEFKDVRLVLEKAVIKAEE